MINYARCIAAATVLFSASVAIAETPAADAPAAAVAAPALEAGARLSTSDGKRLGRIERIVTDKSGAPIAASVIVDSRFAYVPAATITSSSTGFVTSLSRADIRKLK